MAIDAHSTTAPAVQPGLLRTWAGAVPVPTPDLTAETVAMLDEVFTGIGDNPDLAAAVQVFSDPGNNLEDVRHGGAGEVCCTAQQTAVADLASALHMRRALEGALDHGTALLAALGLPMLVEPGFVPLDPATIGDALDTAVATLDALDAPGLDLEEDDFGEPGGDDEEALGWTAGMSQAKLGPNTPEGDSTAPERHGMGFVRCGPDDCEPEAGYDLPEGDDERCGSGDVDLEPSLGAPENHDQAPDQEHWAQGGYSNYSDVEIGEDESQTDKELPFDARQANEAAAREAGRQAMAMRRRKDRRATPARDPEEVQFGNLRLIDGWTVSEMGAAYA